jgi:hypothetical protein
VIMASEQVRHRICRKCFMAPPTSFVNYLPVLNTNDNVCTEL